VNPLLGGGIVIAALGGCFASLRLLEKRFSPHPEILRKLMHVAMGLVASTFPWLFDRIWPVVALAGTSFFVLLVVRSGVIAAMRSLQGVLHGIERVSWGELLFPVSVAFVFVLADGNALLYTVPILILTLADAIAALIGIYYGQTRFSTLEGNKSVEGSVAFFIITFLCVHIALLLFTEVGRLESVLIGLLMGVIVMMFEAVAWRGLDNLFIPLGSFVLLQTYLDMDVQRLSVRLAIIVLSGLFLLFWRRRTTLDGSALIGACLVAYGAWTLGGFYWFLVPLLTFVAATMLRQGGNPGQRTDVHTVYALLGISGPGLLWLLLSNSIGAQDLFVPYALSFGANMAMMEVARAHHGRERIPPTSLLLPAVEGWLVVVIPLFLMTGITIEVINTIIVALVCMLGAAFGFSRVQPDLENCPVDSVRWIRQATISTAVSVLAWLWLAKSPIGTMS
jgi:phytol kinase